jgi:hypothetical protein
MFLAGHSIGGTLAMLAAMSAKPVRITHGTEETHF